MQSSSRNGAKVIWLGVHTTEGIMRAAALRDWTAWAGSSHAASDETGALLTPADGFVPYDRAAWTLRNGNPLSENIEQCGWARWTRAEWLARPKLLDATARWLAERSKARGIPLVHLSLADIRARKPGVLGHGDYTYATGDGTHTDPGPNYPWDLVINKARAYAAQEDDMPLTEAEIGEIVHRVLDTDVGGGSLADFIRANNKQTIPAAVWAEEIPRPAPATPIPAGELLGWLDLTASQARDQAAAVATLAAQRAGLSDQDIARVAEAVAGLTADDVAAQLAIVRKDSGEQTPAA